MENSDLELIKQTHACVRKRMAGQQAGHGFDHVLRVWKSACEIQSEVGGNRLVIELAALLHDVGDAKFCDGVERSAEYARDILEPLGTDHVIIEHVAEIVDNISFRKGVDPATLTLEGKIVQDADRLDALGAIGIVRTIEYGVAKNQPFYRAGDNGPNSGTGIGHFYDKLFKLRSLLNTAGARKIAERREAFMHAFVKQYAEEMGEDTWGS
jgi:uncharacterized protein